MKRFERMSPQSLRREIAKLRDSVANLTEMLDLAHPRNTWRNLQPKTIETLTAGARTQIEHESMEISIAESILSAK
ncbi:MAG: hypothetical protein ABI867_08440 [Kofleriaceae bacterium]